MMTVDELITYLVGFPRVAVVRVLTATNYDEEDYVALERKMFTLGESDGGLPLLDIDPGKGDWWREGTE